MIWFYWKKTLCAGEQECNWRGLRLVAFTNGEWAVGKLTYGQLREHYWIMLVDHAMQTKGKDINEAKQRAQAAAIVQLQLTGVKPQ